MQQHNSIFDNFLLRLPNHNLIVIARLKGTLMQIRKSANIFVFI